MIDEEHWSAHLDRAKETIGENKDAPIMAAYLLDEVDVLVTSNIHDFPLDDYEAILTPREFIDTIDSTE